MKSHQSHWRWIWMAGRAAAIAAGIVAAACGGGRGPVPEAPQPEQPLACLAMPDGISLSASATGSSEWNDVLIDERGHLWLAGYRDGIVGQSNVEPSGPSRAVLRLLSPGGETVWSAEDLFHTGFTDVAEAIALGRSGYLYVTGRTTGNVPGGNNAGQFDTVMAWSAQPTTEGAWRLQQFGTERPQHPRRIRLAADGDVVVAGYDDEYVPSSYVAAWSDPFALRLRRVVERHDEFQVRWTHQFASAEPDTVDGLAVDAAGATYLAGAVTSGAERGMFVRKLDSTGQVMWTARLSSAPVDNIASVEVIADGSVLVAGSVYGSFQGAPPIGEQDLFVARLSAADGRVLQRWQFGSAGADWLVDMQLGRDGSIYLLGETTGSFIQGRPSGGNVDLFVLQLSADGSLTAQRQAGTPGDKVARRLAVDRCGRVAVVGAAADTGRRRALLWVLTP